jgi:ABC-type lipoprotein release transport system permease subunit
LNLPYELRIGLRYTRAGRRARRRNGFISFISGISMLGIALGVMALIVVLSVMNGFVSQVRDRMLSVVSHIEVFALNGPIDWRQVSEDVRRNSDVIGAAPYVNAQGLLTRGDAVRGVLVRGVDPAAEPAVSDVARQVRGEPLTALKDGEFNIVLGGELARALGVSLGEKITLIAPQGQVTPAGVVPRLKQFTLTGTFDSGHYEYDSALALIHIADAQRADIAILRTLGATPRSVMAVFMVQGALIGVLGTLLGVAGGLIVANNLDSIFPTIERLAGFPLIPQDIYFISSLPSDPRASDVVPIAVISIVLSLVATLYPSWRASRVRPAEALRYD